VCTLQLGRTQQDVGVCHEDPTTSGKTPLALNVLLHRASVPLVDPLFTSLAVSWSVISPIKFFRSSPHSGASSHWALTPTTLRRVMGPWFLLVGVSRCDREGVESTGVVLRVSIKIWVACGELWVSV
jgi:hypothetical protein